MVTVVDIQQYSIEKTKSIWSTLTLVVTGHYGIIEGGFEKKIEFSIVFLSPIISIIV